MANQLSQTDKNHWRDLIAKKIAKKIETIKASDPARFSNLGRQAHTEALVSLGLDSFDKEIHHIEAQIEVLNLRKTKAQRMMIAHLRNIDVDDLDDYISGYGRINEIDEAVKTRAAVIHDKLMAKDDLGQQVLKLEAEKEDLLNSVYLATATSQIKELYASMLALIDETPTQLTGKAMAIKPPKED